MSAAPLMTPHRGDAHPAQRLTYIGYILQLKRLDEVQPFTLEEHRLYTKLLDFFNDRDKEWAPRWESFADTFLCMATGIKSVNTIKKARAGLEARGLIVFDGKGKGAGRGNFGKYYLLMVGADAPFRAVLPAPGSTPIKLSSDDSFHDSFIPDDEGKLSGKLSRKLSPDDTNIESNRGVDSSNGVAARLQKKIDEHQFSQPENDAAADGPNGAGEGTGGATDVPTRLIPQPLQEGEFIPGGFVDKRLPENDPEKYVAWPRDAAMVDEYLANHSDPEKRQHAGKGQLFIDYYEGKGRCTGKEALTPIRSWRHVANSFGFVDYNAERKAKQLATGGSQVERRLTAAERVAEKLRKEAGDE